MFSVPFRTPMGFTPWAVVWTALAPPGPIFKPLAFVHTQFDNLTLLALLRFHCLRSRQKPINCSILISWRRALGGRWQPGWPVEHSHHRRRVAGAWDQAGHSQPELQKTAVQL